MRLRLLIAAFLAAAAYAAAQAPLPTGGQARLRSAKDFEWKPSTTLPPGAEYELLREDPVSHGIQAIVNFPSGYKIPAHQHDADETLVVLKGKLWVRVGNEDRVLGPGDYALLPAGVEHELAVRGWKNAWVLATTSGPFVLRKP